MQGRELLIEIGCGPGQSGSGPRLLGLRAVRGQVVRPGQPWGGILTILNTAGSRQCAVSRSKTQSDLHLEASQVWRMLGEKVEAGGMEMNWH